MMNTAAFLPMIRHLNECCGVFAGKCDPMKWRGQQGFEADNGTSKIS